MLSSDTIKFKCTILVGILFKYIIPTLYIIVILLNILNTFIFSSSKSQLYKYLKANSITDTIMFIIFIFTIRPTCMNDENITLSYWFQWFDLIIRIYLLRVIFMISALINVKIAYDRFKSLKNSALILSNLNRPIKRLIILFTLFSIMFYSQNFFIYTVCEIEKTANQSEIYTMPVYSLSIIQNLKNWNFVKKIIPIFEASGAFITLILMVVINTLTFKRFQSSQKVILVIDRRMNRNLTELKNFNKGNQITKMVIWISSVFIFQQSLLILASVIKMHLFSFYLHFVNFQIHFSFICITENIVNLFRVSFVLLF